MVNLGTVVESFDFNGHRTSYGYDEFARLSRVVKPLDTAGYPTVEYSYVLAQPFGQNGLINYIEKQQLDREPGTPGDKKRDHYYISRQFVDGLGRGITRSFK